MKYEILTDLKIKFEHFASRLRVSLWLQLFVAGS